MQYVICLRGYFPKKCSAATVAAAANLPSGGSKPESAAIGRRSEVRVLQESVSTAALSMIDDDFAPERSITYGFKLLWPRGSSGL